MIRCLIIDDEPIARLGLERYLSQVKGAVVVGTAGNTQNGATLLQAVKPDLMFLDINLPGMNGIDFLKSSSSLPLTIIVTAYPEFALEGYELDLVDYLVKPVSFERFLKAYRKAEKLLDKRVKSGKHQDCFYVRVNRRYQQINFQDIIFMESLLNYVRIFTMEKTYVVYASLKAIEGELPSDQFLRIHKSYIVSMNKVTALDGATLLLGKKALPISRNLRDLVYNKILAKRCK